MPCNDTESHLSPRLSSGTAQEGRRGSQEATNLPQPCGIPASAPRHDGQPDTASPESGPPTDRPRGDRATAHATRAAFIERLRHADGRPFELAPWQAALLNGVAATQDLEPLDLADPERFRAAHRAGAGCSSCGDQLPAGYPASVPCGGCLAEQLPGRVAAELRTDLPGAPGEDDGRPERGAPPVQLATSVTRGGGGAASAAVPPICFHCGGSGVRCCELAAERGPIDAIGQPLPTAARLAALPFLTGEIGLTMTAAATLVDAVAEALEGDRPEDAFQRARLALDLTAAYRLVATVLGAAERTRASAEVPAHG